LLATFPASSLRAADVPPATLEKVVEEAPVTIAGVELVYRRLYLRTTDGTLLAVTTWRPNREGRFATIFQQSPYGEGEAAVTNVPTEPIKRGYAFVGASIRGSGCSGGYLDIFTPREGRDGAQVIEWIATESWSNGKVGMEGVSYPGITQFPVAAQQPPHLAAIVPSAFFGDIYRDVLYPGGIYEWGMPVIWPRLVGNRQDRAIVVSATANDQTCLANQQEQLVDDSRHDLLLWTAQRPYDGLEYRARSPVAYADRIDVPTMLFEAFQDYEAGVRGTELYEFLAPTPRCPREPAPLGDPQRCRVPKKLVMMNGGHGSAGGDTVFKVLKYDWLDYWLKGVDNGALDRPAVTIGFEGGRIVRTYADWPPPETEYRPLYLRAGGHLSPERPTTAEASDPYPYPSVGPGASLNGSVVWRYSEPVGVHYVTEPFAEDTLVLGRTVLTLYASSTATDTDFQVVLSLVDPAGATTWVQRGFLRASHRAIDPSRSKPFWPYLLHTHAEPLVPNQAYRLDIPIWPMGQAFRAGSRRPGRRHGAAHGGVSLCPVAAGRADRGCAPVGAGLLNNGLRATVPTGATR
jgi:putative CocE/NonD family hydrolase